MKLETVAVVKGDGFRLINKSDYDESVHELYEAPAAPEKVEQAAPEQAVLVEVEDDVEPLEAAMKRQISKARLAKYALHEWGIELDVENSRKEMEARLREEAERQNN